MSRPTPDGSKCDPTTDLVTITPRVLAGPGVPATALEILDQAGWPSENDHLANLHAHAPDRRAYVSFWPEADPDLPATSRWWPERPEAVLDGRGVEDRLRLLWLVKAYAEPFDGAGGHRDPLWGAAFGDRTPAELVAAFLTAVVDPAREVTPTPQPPSVAFQVLDAAGWRVEPGAHGRVHAWSPDQRDDRVCVCYRPDVPDATDGVFVDRLAPLWRSAWQVETSREPDDDGDSVWAAAFSVGVPVGLVAAFLTAVVDPAGIRRDPLEPHTLLHPPAPTVTT